MPGGRQSGRRGRAPRGVRQVLSAAFLLTWLAGAANAASVPDVVVKATYLYKLAPFVDWPAGALGSPGGPFSICVIGHDPFGAVLDQAAAGQQVGGRPIVIRRVGTGAPILGCAIAYLGGSPQAVHEALLGMGDAPVLTVTDGAEGGVIDLVKVKDHERFKIDEAQAVARHLKLGSQLLGLAISVNRARGGRP